MTLEDERHQMAMRIAEELRKAMFTTRREYKAAGGIPPAEWGRFLEQFRALGVPVVSIPPPRGNDPRVTEVLAVAWNAPTGPFLIYYDSATQKWHDYPPPPSPITSPTATTPVEIMHDFAAGVNDATCEVYLETLQAQGVTMHTYDADTDPNWSSQTTHDVTISVTESFCPWP